MKSADPLDVTSDDSPGEVTNPNFQIVGLGASAGGILALRQFFENVSPDSGLAYVAILHLSPDHDSKLAEILQLASKIPVMQVKENLRIQPNHVYVVPPNQHLTVEDHHIRVSPNLQVEDRHAPVDIFFRSLAEAHGSEAICVVLSGTGADGSMGLKRIKERGGTVFVQSPREAEFNEMPRHAIATELVDQVLPVSEMPATIVNFVRRSVPSLIVEQSEQRPPDQQFALREVFAQLRLRTGHDFTNYKRPTLLRRIERRIRVRNLEDLPAYAAYLQQSTDEAAFLLKDLLISVTNFFRDKDAFETIEKDVLPEILRTKAEGEEVRIWIAGCATGEEAYSIAFLWSELTEGIIDAPKIQIFATDIDDDAVAQSREGLFTINDAADVSPERLRRFFRREAEGYRIRREIREMILFANHNVITDPPFSKLDMVSCRNLLIYFNGIAQERVMETFHFALVPGGFLFTGTSESTDGASDLYTTYNREHHIYRTREVTTFKYPLPETVPMLSFQKPVVDTPAEKAQRTLDRITYGDLHQQLLEKYAPPSVLVNEDYDIIHLSDRAGRYLQMPGGDLSTNLLKLVRPELRLELRSALYQATQRQIDVGAMGLKINVDDRTEVLNIHVRPVMGVGEVGHGFILVMFERTADEVPKTEVILSDDEPMVRRLEDELIRLKAQLRASSEQHEFQSEELRATNEELQAMNEEARTVAEELETSKEELQSINEELRTVNQELKVRVEETTIASNNLQNLINSVDLATIFLDRSFRVNLFSPGASKIFNLIPADNGRLLSNITSTLNYDNLTKDAELVLEKLQPIEREVSSNDGPIYLMRVLPYRTQEDRINGVVITFFDITKRKQAEQNLRASEERLRLLVESAKDYAIYTQDVNRKVNTWNSGAEMMFGYSEKEVLGLPADTFFVPEDRERGAPETEVQKARDLGKAENERWHLRKDRSRFYGSGMVRPLFDQAQVPLGFVTIMRDLTENKQSEQALRESEERLRVTMNSATDYAIITLDIDGLVTSWSRGAEIIFGFNEKEAISRYCEFIFTDEDRVAGAPEKEMREAIRVNRANDERWHQRKDGSRFFMSGVMTPIFSNNRAVGFVKVARDMTDRRLLEQQKDEFIGIASHELKTPITSIKAYTELLLESFDEAGTKSKEMVEKLDDQVDRLIDLIRDLLDTTRISEGRLTLRKEKIDLNGLIKEYVEDLQRVNTTHRLVFQPSALAPIQADKERIGQVIVNLVTNAVKYSPAAGEVIISTLFQGNQAEVSITDRGVGIPADERERIFERFYRVNDPRIQNFSGMGLGLYISAGIIVRHGGSILVGNTSTGVGSVFRFTLPYTA